MRKKIVIALLLLVAVLSSYFYLKSLSPKVEDGTKTIYVTIIDEIAGVTLIDKRPYETTALTLGQFLDESHDGMSVTISEGTFARSIDEINGLYSDLYSSTGPWIVYESPNNQACALSGFCDAIDEVPIYDQDHFIFKYVDSFSFE